MSIADKLQVLAENEQRISNEVGDQADLIAQISSVIDEKLAGGGEETVNKLAGLVDGTATEFTAEDLAGVTVIRRYAFYYYSTLTSIEIPDSVTSIGNYAFGYCSSLTEFVIPNSVTLINSFAVAYCDNLTSIVIPDSVTTIGTSAFRACKNLKNLVIGNGVTTIRDNAFYDCQKIENIVIGNGVTNIYSSAFSNCSSLTSIIIPKGVTSIGNYVFYGCTSLKRVDLSNHTAIPSLGGKNVFQNTHSTLQIKVPANLVDSWKSATNWSDYASKIVTEFTNEV